MPVEPVSVQIPVAWGDMDAFGHVNNTVYLRWFETARIAFFRAVDRSLEPVVKSRFRAWYDAHRARFE